MQQQARKQYALPPCRHIDLCLPVMDQQWPQASLGATAAFAATSAHPATTEAAAAVKPTAGTGATAVIVTAPMTIDCGTMSAKAHRYAVAHGYCSSGSSSSPDAVKTGNCGSSEIYIYTDYYTPALGWAEIKYGFASTLGTVVYRNLVVAYAGEPTPSHGT